MYAPSFALFYAFTWLIAQLPSKTINVFSDILRFFIYRVFRYRVKVVRENLRNSFPEKSVQELVNIEQKFYVHLCDLIFENFFLLHASRERAMRRCRFVDIEQFEKLHAHGRSAILATGHYGNWELFALMGARIKHYPLGVYKPLNDKRFEGLLNKARERFGGVPVPMYDTLRVLIQYMNSDKPALLGLVTDQTPPAADIKYWTNFLNQQTPVFLGVEKIAQKLDLPVYFCSMNKVKRGKYEVRFTLLTDKPKECKPYEITEMHVKALEELIRKHPEFWLWSHRRWKHKPPKD